MSKKQAKKDMINHLKISKKAIDQCNKSLFYNSLEKYHNTKIMFLAQENVTSYHKFTKLDNLANDIFIIGSDKFK